MQFSTSIVLLLAFVAYFAYTTLRRRNRAPGPRRLPLLGNILQVPYRLQFIQYSKWAKKYGPMFSLDLLGQHVVVLNTYEAAAGMFDCGSNIYNDRPRLVMANEILGGGIFLPLMKYGDRWRRMRRAANNSFNSRAVQKYKSIQTEAAALAMLRIIADPKTWEHQLTTFAASSIFSSVYGWPALGHGTSVVKHMNAFIAHLTDAARPGVYLVDFFPVLKYLPSWMARWKREGTAWNRAHWQLAKQWEESVASRIASGEPQDGLVADLIAGRSRYGLLDEEMTWLPAILISGAIKTTAATVMNCVLALLHHPDVLAKAQAELDAIVGRARAPALEDRKNLLYIQAIVRETLRWRPVGPLGLPHLATEDSWYAGFFIPQGTVIMGNIWAMNRDPSVHHDADTFRPERFLDATGKHEVIYPNTHDIGHTTFGFGRRICPGMHFAEQELFIAIATLLWAFDLKPPHDKEGNTMFPSLRDDDLIDAGAVLQPKSFECTFTPRCSEMQEILKRATP
ncbi:cytochrome P450 [Irpex lacteus]|nr:cytochrome P450 [Irpex lacteus]